MTPVTPPSPVELHLEPPDDAMRIWLDSFKYIAEAAPDSGYELNDIRSALHSGSMQLWTVSKSGALSAVCVTQIKLRILHIVLNGGKEPSWNCLLPDIENWGREQGCKRVVYSGPSDLTRSLGSDWRETRRTLEKEL